MAGTGAGGEAAGDDVDLDVLAATLQALLDGSGARRVTVVIDRGADRPPLVVDAEPGALLELSEGGPDSELLPPGAGLASDPLPLPPMRPVPPVEVDPHRGEIVSLPGAVEHLAGLALHLAGLLPGRSVATAEWATTDPDVPMTVAARTGDPVVIALGEEQFEMPESWP
jgi:hypothetical protein